MREMCPETVHVRGPRASSRRRSSTAARGLVATLLAAAISGCAGVERTVYESLQGIQAQQCELDYSRPCPARQSYDQYRRLASQ